MPLINIFNFRVRRRMAGLMRCFPPELKQRSSYILRGKFLRSSLMQKCAALLSLKDREILPYASMLELIHSASIIHDDVIDLQLDRRGKKTINYYLKNRISVLSGNLLITCTLSEFPVLGDRKIEKAFYDKIVDICVGETKQDTNTDIRHPLSPAGCINIARLKTGALFALSFTVPGLLSGMDRSLLSFLEELGFIHGTLYQLFDDYQDMLYDVKENDHQFRHWTLPLIFWRRKYPKLFDKFIRGENPILPDSLYTHIRDRLALMIHDMLFKLRKKYRIEKKPALRPYYELMLDEIERFSPLSGKLD